jgi:hypothetical protein
MREGMDGGWAGTRLAIMPVCMLGLSYKHDALALLATDMVAAVR